MKKKAYSVIAAALILCLLTACGCKHEWSAATCTSPKACSLCGESEGDALGHSWNDATCDVPKTCTACGTTEGAALGHTWQEATCEAPATCTVCGGTEGDALGHNYEKWAIDGETMTRSCTVCGLGEVSEIDRALFLFDQLPGRWDCTKVEYPQFDRIQKPEYVFANAFPYTEIGADRTIHYFNGTDHFDGSLQFTKYVSDDEMEAYYFYAAQDGTPQMLFVLDVTPGEDRALYSVGQFANFRFEPETEEVATMRQAVVGTWNATERYVEAEPGHQPYTDCTITLREDHSFSLTVDGVPYDGIWLNNGSREYSDGTVFDYWIQYPRDDRRAIQLLRITNRTDGSIECIINFDNEFTVYLVKE